jgi:uncharacterized membrane protein YidH (DUF202 family)
LSRESGQWARSAFSVTSFGLGIDQHHASSAAFTFRAGLSYLSDALP